MLLQCFRLIYRVRKEAQDQMARRARHRPFQPHLELLEDRAVPSASPALGDIFYIDMENHNLTQPASLTQPPNPNGYAQQLLGNPAAPYLNSLITPGNLNAQQTSFASDYQNAAVGNHPSEPNYVWQEAGLAGPLNDNPPYPNNIVNASNLSGLLQGAGISWKSYQEDIDLVPSSRSVNQPGASALTGTVANSSQWTVPLSAFSGTSPSYTNAYNGSHQYGFDPKHDGQLFFTATNGGDNTTPSNPEAPFYSPLEQLQSDLTNNTVARYNLITPDLYNDMHSSLANGFTYHGTAYTGDEAAIAEGDNFLSDIIPQIMASKAYKNNGAIVLWFDETEGPDPASDTPGDGYSMAEIVISPLAKGNAYDSTLAYSHSSDLKSMEELFGVYAPGGGFLGAANAPTTNDLSDLFKPGALNLSTLQGTAYVDLPSVGSFRAGDPGVSGLTVTLTGTNGINGQSVSLATATGYNGSYSFTGLLPGIYTITISPAEGLQNDFTTRTGTIDITIGADQAVSDLDFGFLVPGTNKHQNRRSEMAAMLLQSQKHGTRLSPG